MDYAKAKAARFGELGIGKDSWPKNNNDWPTGFYVGNLRLENLTDFQSEAPYKCICVAQVKDSKEAEGRLKKAATRILGGDEYQQLEFERKENQVSCWRWLEESRQDLRKLLVEDDSPGFIECLARHFDWMIRFTGVIDECVNCKKGGK
ncbi:MAG: hypothetical protein FJ271_26155 [Planctomycetes bacterium]|nr:hypothetical protein [Planctomycetota bacterium]